MKYVLIHNLLSSCSKKPIYVGEKEVGNFIYTTDDVEKAIKFCWSMKKQKMFLIGWECVDPEDNEELNKRVNMQEINNW